MIYASAKSDAPSNIFSMSTVTFLYCSAVLLMLQHHLCYDGSVTVPDPLLHHMQNTTKGASSVVN